MPYTPVTLHVPERHSSGGLRFFFVIGALVLVFGVIALGLYIRNKRLQTQVDREVRQIMNSAGTSQV